MVPGAGVEPAWSYLRGILSPLCLPISPPGPCILWCPGRESNPHATRTLEPKSSLSTSSNTWARRRIVRSSCRRGNRPRLLLSWIWLKSLSGIADYFSVRRVAFDPSDSLRVNMIPFYHRRGGAGTHSPSIFEVNIQHQAFVLFFATDIDATIINEKGAFKADFAVDCITGMKNMPFAICTTTDKIRIGICT